MQRTVELGRATTDGQALPLGSDDPVIAARAVRRALAAAGQRAADVSDLVVATAEPIADDILGSFARRALGPRGASAHARSIVGAALEAATLADLAVEAAKREIDDRPSREPKDLMTRRTPEDRIAIVVGLAPDGTAEARCLSLG